MPMQKQKNLLPGNGWKNYFLSFGLAVVWLIKWFIRLTIGRLFNGKSKI